VALPWTADWGKVALITRGDSSIGRAVALAFATEGANIAFAFNHSNGDAMETRPAWSSGRAGAACRLWRM